MSKNNALKFIILQKLNQNKGLLNINLHKQIAYSLNIKIEKEFFVISWEVNNDKKELTMRESEFNFYVKSEYDQISDREQIDKNEINANEITLKIINQSLS